MSKPYKIFAIYAREDALYLNELLGQLRPLEMAGHIKVWSDREINPGVEWEKEITKKLDTADIILILVSSAYYSSVYIHEVEINYALSRHEKGEARVLPVIIRPCSFGDDPVISRLQVLPTDGKAVTDSSHWFERDEAWFDVVTGIKRVLQTIAAKEDPLQENASDTEWRTSQSRETEQTHATSSIPTNPFYEGKTSFDPHTPQKRTADRHQREAAPAIPLWRYVAISIGTLALLLIGWELSILFKGKEAQLPQSLTNSTQGSVPDATHPSSIGQIADLMVPVAGGSFMMGDKEALYGECLHPVSVAPFKIGKYEVTQAQWKAVMMNNPSVRRGCDDCPVDNVSWNDVQKFIENLNLVSINTKEYRLPTEAEWEFAARGGNQSKGYVYAGSNEMDEVAWYAGLGGYKSHPVGGKKPNELGLYDMNGNVQEYCQDTYKPYPCDPDRKADNSMHIIRGGSWISADKPTSRFANLVKTDVVLVNGFRLAQN